MASINRAQNQVVSCLHGLVLEALLPYSNVPAPPTTELLALREGNSEHNHVTQRLPSFHSLYRLVNLLQGIPAGDDFITKPFDIVEFVARVKTVLRRSD